MLTQCYGLSVHDRELTMTLLLLGAPLALLGIVAGIYVAGLIHDHRISDLSASQYMAMHQMRDKTFARVMPVMALATLVLVTASAALVIDPGLPRIAAACTIALLVVDTMLTVARQLPLNRQIQSWTEATIPANWTNIRDRWAAQHRTRALLGVTAFACLLPAVMLTAHLA
jgi:hypothetical protein